MSFTICNSWFPLQIAPKFGQCALLVVLTVAAFHRTSSYYKFHMHKEIQCYCFLDVVEVNL